MTFRFHKSLSFQPVFAVVWSRQDAHMLWSPVAAESTDISPKTRPRQDGTGRCNPVAAESMDNNSPETRPDRTELAATILSRLKARTFRRKHGRDRTEQAATILSRQEARTFRRKHGHDRTEQAATILSRLKTWQIWPESYRDRIERSFRVLSRPRFRVKFCGARAASF